MSGEEFGGLVSAGLARNSLSTLEHDFDVELAHADEEVDATAADSKIAELFAVAPGTPLLRIRQVIYSRPRANLLFMSLASIAPIATRC